MRPLYKEKRTKMKRSHDETDVDIPSSKPKLEESVQETKQENADILHDLHSRLLKDNDQLNNHISKQLLEAQKQYFSVYIQTVMDKIPMGRDLVKIVNEMGGGNEFEYTFTAATSIINSLMKVSQIKTFHAVFDMVYELIGKYAHEKVISPALGNVVPPDRLEMAFEAYQQYAKAEEDKSVLELQCLLYCIQEIMEKEETLQIPNPLYSRMTQQMKAVSEYVITLLVSLATKHKNNPEVVNPETEFVTHQEKEVLPNTK